MNTNIIRSIASYKCCLDKANHRPVSILPCISKLYEGVMSDQLAGFMEDIFSRFLSAYRKQHSCQHVLIDLIEEWREKLDNKFYVGAVLMDLSKAFDCLPHHLLIAKLRAYGLAEYAIKFVSSYLSDRSQRVKIGSVVGLWEQIIKGVPQGSILGPLLFNIFMNDIFYILNDLKNYADDNTISQHDKELDNLKHKLSQSSETAVQWFHENYMLANGEKFHCILLGPDRQPIDTTLTFNDITIESEHQVELLGIFIDDKLSFDKHISELVRKAGNQLNALKRIGSFLSQDCRLLIFRTFVLSNFNYCPLVWHFCGAQNTDKLEKIQKRGLQFVYRDYTSSYEDLLERAGLNTLYLNRLKSLAVQVYQTIKGLGPAYLKEIFKERVSVYNLRGAAHNALETPTIRTETFGRHSLRALAPQVWNSLPNEYREAVTLSEFKKLLKSWSGVKCNCQLCKTAN